MYECPKCHDDNLSVDAVESTRAYINRDGDVVDSTGGGIEWDDDAEMTCHDCGHRDVASSFFCKDE